MSGFASIMKETEKRGCEIGAVLYRDDKNELKVKVITESKEYPWLVSSGLSAVSYWPLDEEDIRRLMNRWHGSKPALKGFDLYFMSPELAQKYPHLLKALKENENNESGREVVVGTPIAPIHSHPSGNLPSSADFNHEFFPGEGGTAAPEIVVSRDWTYFLVATKQTPDAEHDLKLREKVERERLGDEDENTVKHILLQSGKEYRAEDSEDTMKAINALRQKNLTDDCLKYYVGFYVLAKGEATAKRVV